MVQVEQYGFDDDVAVIVQPRGKFYGLDDSRIDQKKDIVAINQATFGEQFFVPSDHDILINFKPIRVH
jgi:hypothetical protein